MTTLLPRHCEEPKATWQSSLRGSGLLRYARNDGTLVQKLLEISLEGGVG
jgi:hypothetical protein